MSHENETTNLPMEIDSSIEQTSSLQPNRKRKFTNEMVKQKEEQEKENRQFDYEKLSEDEIKKKLFKTIVYDNQTQNNVNHWFEIDRTLLPFIRQYASLLSNYYFIKTELQLYQSYINMTQSMLPWLQTMSKTLLQHSNINYDQFLKLQKYITQQLKTAEKEFEILIEKLAKMMSDQQQQQQQQQPHMLSLSSSTLAKIDIPFLRSLIVSFVREDQEQYNIEFIKKRHLLMLYVKDISLVHDFYYLQRDAPQQQIATTIWRTTLLEQQQQDSNLTFNNQQNNYFRRDYANQIEKLKKQFLTQKQTDKKENCILPTNYHQLNIDLLMNIIETRQKILAERHKFENDFNSFFPIRNDEDDTHKPPDN